jgi:transglutaminase-like putative cysteine protease
MQPRAVTSVACLAVAAGSSWSALIAAPAIRFDVVLALAATPALLAVSGLSHRAAATVGVLCVPGLVLLAGAPASALTPTAWPQSAVHLASAAAQFAAPLDRPTASSWSLALVMLASAAAWMAGATLLTPDGVSTRQRLIAFVLLAAPWLVGLGETAPNHTAWQGALVLLGGVLWFSRSGAVIPLGIITAVLSIVVAQAVGPHKRWFGLGERVSEGLPFRSLDTQPTYGPLIGRRTGAPMLEVTAAQPALWRMQTLDYFNGSGWTTAPSAFPALPQPDARRERIAVRVIRLRQDLVVAPGRVDRVQARGSVVRAAGEAWRVEPWLRAGGTYRVVASTVRVSADRLAGDRAPLSRSARAYTELEPTTKGMTGLLLEWLAASVGVSPSALARPAVDPRVVALARQLVSGARTEWDKVVRVERFLLDDGRFRYTTHVPAPGPQPLVDFLLRTHAGYCEQFASAAALLLRIAGVPSRVVAGFATGMQTAPHQYTVRDLDAHDWIEVYFPGVGWVTFNPTPSASPATIGGGLGPLSLPTPRDRNPSYLAAPALLCALAGGLGLVLMRRRGQRRSGRPPEPLERIAGRTVVRLQPSTTLAQLGVLLGRIGPRLAALAAETERARFAPGSATASRYPRIRLLRALVSDVGPLRAVLVWLPLPRRIRARSNVVPPTPNEGKDEQRNQ